MGDFGGRSVMLWWGCEDVLGGSLLMWLSVYVCCGVVDAVVF